MEDRIKTDEQNQIFMKIDGNEYKLLGIKFWRFEHGHLL